MLPLLCFQARKSRINTSAASTRELAAIPKAKNLVLLYGAMQKGSEDDVSKAVTISLEKMREMFNEQIKGENFQVKLYWSVDEATFKKPGRTKLSFHFKS